MRQVGTLYLSSGSVSLEPNALDEVHLDILKKLNIKPYDFFDNIDDWSKLSEFGLTYKDVEWVKKYTANPIKQADLNRLLGAKSVINPECFALNNDHWNK